MSNWIKNILENKKNGKYTGIASLCSSNPFVIEAALLYAKEKDTHVLIESTANQVNQYGGYMNMMPADFIEYVGKMADKVGYPRDRIIFGGDHLGPLTFTHLPESEAMKEAEDLVHAYAKAGFSKIHLDTSMRLKDDDPSLPLEVKTIAKRGALLCKTAEEAAKASGGTLPYYIVGSEVPIPGGAQEKEDHIEVTSKEDLLNTVNIYKETFEEEGLSYLWDRVIGVVVQPGVEFSDDQVFYYDPEKAVELKNTIATMDNMVLEGHSTDYQRPEDLKNMVKDGIAILKVGPGLTYALREGLFRLAHIETILIKRKKRSHLISVLDNVMLENPKNWENHYFGTKRELKVKRLYSYSDRIRYYMEDKKVKKAIDKLLKNLDRVTIPDYLMKQYMPGQYQKKTEGKTFNTAKDYLLDHVMDVLEDYEQAVL